ncbi:MAG: hypothetical protein J6D47_07000 [Peptostreptococcaceae bacterium]|nr:hypothetical protein [Peptostreptococcaceae bacterium]
MSKMKSIREIEMERATEPNFGKGITVASGFDLGAKAPLDSRITVKTIEERDAHVTGNRAYEGMLVYVEADKKTYQLIDNAWEEFGFNEEKFQAGVQPIVDKNAEQDERLTTLEGLVVGGEGEGLGAVIADVAKNKADIAELQTDLSDEISARESADALINAEISKNKASITNLQEGLAEEVSNRESADALINEELGKKANQSDLQAEVTRATGVEQGLNTRLTDAEGKIVVNETNIGVNAQAIADEVTNRKTEITRVESLVVAEKERAEGVEQGLQTAIDGKVSKEDFNAEQGRVNSALDLKATKEEVNVEKERVDGLFEQVNTTLEGHGTLIQTVTELANDNKEKKADKTQVALDIATGVETAKGYADEKLVEAKSYADGKLVEGKAYTDEEIVKVNATISDLDTAYKASDAQVLEDARAHADKAVADLVNGAPEALDTLKELADALTSHESAYDSLLEVVGKKANSEDVYTKAEVDGIKSGLETSIGRVETEYKQADVVLGERLTAVEDITSGVGAIRSELDKAKEDIVTNATEIAGCKTSIGENADAIAQEVSARTQAVNTLDGKITAERERAEGVEASLNERLTTVNSGLEEAKGNISANASAIAEEVANRQSAVSALDAKVTNMATVVGSVQPVDRLEGHIWIEML